MKPPRRVLVIVTRRIGDVLLATPLIRALRRAYPHALISALVFADTRGILAGNPDLDEIVTVTQRPTVMAHLRLLVRIARRYDVALSLVPGDRPTLYAWLAGRWRAGLVVDELKNRWKRWLLQRWVPFDDAHTHTVVMHLALARTLAIAPSYDVVVGWRDEDCAGLDRHLPFDRSEPYAVLHPSPKFRYKMWRAQAWTEIIEWLHARGIRAVLSGGSDGDELEYVAAIAHAAPQAVNLAGKITLSAAACLLAQARVYIGPDTAVTHMAAALGIPVIALYGPGNPVKWGPWPAGYTSMASPWRRYGTQRVGNVTLIQGNTACVPCLLEGCDRHIASYSDCLQELPVRRVTEELAALLDAPQVMRQS